MILALSLMNAALLNRAERPPRAKRQIREGMSYVLHRGDLLLVLCVAFFVGTFGMNFQMTSALMAQQQFHKGAEAYGILGTFMAVGSLTGALLAARRKVRPARPVRGADGAGLRRRRGAGRRDADLRRRTPRSSRCSASSRCSPSPRRTPRSSSARPRTCAGG